MYGISIALTAYVVNVVDKLVGWFPMAVLVDRCDLISTEKHCSMTGTERKKACLRSYVVLDITTCTEMFLY